MASEQPHADSTYSSAVANDPDDLLRQIGIDLDQRRTLVVYGGGMVWPSTGRPPQYLGTSEEVIANGETREQTGSEGSATGSRQGTAVNGAARSRTTGSAASFLSAVVGWDADRRADLQEAIDAYEMVPSIAAPGVWLSTTVTPVFGNRASADLVVGVPNDVSRRVKGWAWWTDGGMPIGPRHTNYPCGSICAFEPPDGTWDRDSSLVRLLDLYAVWVAKQMHLLRFGLWPGEQALHTASERLREHRPHELCGGCRSLRMYKNCCKPKDLRMTSAEVEREFKRKYPAGIRIPPRNREHAMTLALHSW
jgi:hypothetical protein